MICRYGVSTNTLLDLNNQKLLLQKSLEGLEDAEQEMMLQEDELDVIHVKVGGVFMLMSAAEAEEHYSAKRIVFEEKLEKVKSDLTLLLEDQEYLKKKLYEKFGDQINLEY